jgi:hypothetical protein
MLEDAEARFMKGDRSGLWLAILATAAGREALPEWARQGLRLALRRLNEGKAADLNEVFGWNNRRGNHKTARASSSKYRRLAPEILQKLIAHRKAGKALTAVEFEDIGEGFGVGRSTVQRVYTTNKAMIALAAADPSATHTGANALIDFWEWDDSPAIAFPWLLAEMLSDGKQRTVPIPRESVQKKRKRSA